MRIVFFGTPDYVLPILDSLHKEFRVKNEKSPVVAVVTQSPKPIGREKFIHYSEVDTWAYKRKIPVFFDSRELVKNNIEADIGILAAYGSIIPKDVIEYFAKGILNIHPSLLPAWRGASPVQATIVAGDTTIGATIIKLDEELDHGPIISQFKEEVIPNDTTDTLRNRLFERAAEVIKTLLPAYLKGKITPRPQEHEKATFTTLLKKDHGFIPPKYFSATLQGEAFKGKWEIGFIKDCTLNPNPFTLERFIRAMQPWPTAWSTIRIPGDKETKRLKILKTHLDSLTISHQSLIIDEVQLEGKTPVSWKQFKEAYSTAIFE